MPLSLGLAVTPRPPSASLLAPGRWSGAGLAALAPRHVNSKLLNQNKSFSRRRRFAAVRRYYLDKGEPEMGGGGGWQPCSTAAPSPSSALLPQRHLRPLLLPRPQLSCHQCRSFFQIKTMPRRIKKWKAAAAAFHELVGRQKSWRPSGHCQCKGRRPICAVALRSPTNCHVSASLRLEGREIACLRHSWHIQMRLARPARAVEFCLRFD